MSEREDDFLGRWARRKAQARGGLQKKQPERAETVRKPGRMRTDPPAPAEAEADAAAQDDEIQQAVLREEAAGEQPGVQMEASPEAEPQPEQNAGDGSENFDDFDFDSLNYESDYTRFMKGGVPEAVRKRALRMLWGSNPILANIDGLNDYDEDFTDAALAVKGLLKSGYKPMSGYLTDEEREASYSKEARKAGARPEDETAEEQVADGAEEEIAAGESKTAEAETATGEKSEHDGLVDDDRTPENNEKA